MILSSKLVSIQEVMKSKLKVRNSERKKISTAKIVRKIKMLELEVTCSTNSL